MAQNNQQGDTQQNSLLGFNFDDDVEFFGVKPADETSQTSGVIKEVKGSTAGTQAQASTEIKNATTTDDEDDEDEVTFFTDEPEKPKVNPVRKKQGTTIDEEDEEEPDTEVETLEDEKKDQPKAKEEKSKQGKTQTKAEEEDGKQSDKGTEKTEDGEDDETFFTNLTEDLKDRKIFTAIELKEGEKVDETKFFDLIDQEVEARLDDVVKEMGEKVDEDGKRYLNFLKNGGKSVDFFRTIESHLPMDEIDEKNTNQLDKVITHYLTTVEKLDDDELKDRLDYINDSGKKAAIAKKYFSKIKEAEEEEKNNLIKTVENARKVRAEKEKQFTDNLETAIKKVETIGDFTFTDKDKKTLVAQITRPTIKVGENKYVPPVVAKIQQILSGKTDKDIENLFLLSKLIMSDFDVSSVKTKTKTTVVKEAKARIRESSKSSRPSSTGSTGGQRNLADLFS